MRMLLLLMMMMMMTISYFCQHRYCREFSLQIDQLLMRYVFHASSVGREWVSSTDYWLRRYR
jgi:hypothetical protein